MIEIVFSDSACGSLKMAQHYGEGKYRGGCTGVIFSKHDGSDPTPAELEEAEKAAERGEFHEAMVIGRMLGKYQLGIQSGFAKTGQHIILEV